MGSAVTSASAIMGLRKTEISLLLAQHQPASGRRHHAPGPQSVEFSSPVLVHIWLRACGFCTPLTQQFPARPSSLTTPLNATLHPDRQGGEGLASQAGLAVIPAGTLMWLSGRLASKVRGHCSGLRRTGWGKQHKALETGTLLHWPAKVAVRTYDQTRLIQMAPRPD